MKNKTFKELSKLKNPMRNKDLVLEFLNKCGEKFNVKIYKAVGFIIKNIKISIYNDDKKNNLVIHFFDSKIGNIYHLTYNIKTKQINQARIYNHEDFSELRELFLKFVLNKELSERVPEKKIKQKINKI